MKFIDKYLEQNDYSNDIVSMGRFEFQQFVNARVKTMELLKFPESEIIDFLEQYSNRYEEKMYDDLYVAVEKT